MRFQTVLIALMLYKYQTFLLLREKSSDDITEDVCSTVADNIVPDITFPNMFVRKIMKSSTSLNGKKKKKSDTLVHTVQKMYPTFHNTCTGGTRRKKK